MTAFQDDASYTPLAKALHWAVVVLLIGQFALALTMPHIERNTRPDTLINLHFSFGALILTVAAVRLAWRFAHRAPMPLQGLPRWQVTGARIMHNALYGLLLVIPVLGWMNASYRGFDVAFFGLFKLPALMAPRTHGFAWTGDIHTLLSYYVLLPAAGVHIAVALHHAMIRKDGLLARMLPARRA